MNPLRQWYLLKMLTSHSNKSKRTYAAQRIGETCDLEFLKMATAAAYRTYDNDRIISLVESYLKVCEPAQVIALYDASKILTWCLEAHKLIERKMISIGGVAVDHLLAIWNDPQDTNNSRRRDAIALLGLTGDMRAIRPLVNFLVKNRSANEARYALVNLRISNPKAFKETVQGYTEEELCILGGATALMIEEAYAKYKFNEKWLDEYYLPGEKSRYPWKGKYPGE